MERYEWNEDNLQEYTEPGAEYSWQDNEITPPLSEYSLSGDEFNEKITEESDKGSKSGKKDRMKRIRKMSYLVAATAAVVVIGRTVELPSEPAAEQAVEETNEEEPNGFQWPKVPGFNGTAEEPEAEVIPTVPAGNLVSVADYESWGYSNGGVIPVKQDGLWGLLDYEGNVILEPRFPVFWSSPNDHGYTVFADNAGFYITNNSGQVVMEFAGDVYDVDVGEDEVILVKEARGENNESLGFPEVSIRDVLPGYVRYRYLRSNGAVIHDTGWIKGDTYFNVAGPYHEKKAFLYITGDMENDVNVVSVLYEVTQDGIREIDREYEIPYVPEPNSTNGGGTVYVSTYAPLGGLSQGYYVAEVPGGGGGWYLFHPETTTSTNRSLGLAKGEDRYSMIDTVELRSYWDNGTHIYNYGTRGVLTVYDDYPTYGGTKLRDVLFDYTSVPDGIEEYYQNEIASYDNIIPDNFPYLAVKDGDTWFYIDYDGNTVSPVYQGATSFNDRGYAMVREGDTAYIINDRFEKVDAIEGIKDIGSSDDVFGVQYLDDSISLYCFQEP